MFHSKTITVFCLFLCFTFFACRKTDTPQTPETAIVKETNEKFFAAPAGTAAQVKTIIENIKLQNKQHAFLDQLIKRAGYAKWDKAKIIADSSAASRTSVGSGGELIYIPL